MKILLALHQYFPEHVGGTEVYTHGIATRLKDLSHEVAVVTYLESPSGNPADFQTTETEYEGIKIFRISFNLSVDPYPAQAEYNNSLTARQFALILQNFRPDLVHFTHIMKLSGSTLQACSDAGIPFMVTLTDFWVICPRHTLLKWDDTLCSGPWYKTLCIKCLHKTHGFFAPPVMNYPDLLLGLAAWSGSRIFKKARSPVWNDTRALLLRNQFLRQQLLKAEHVICLSDFQKSMIVKNGYPADKLMVLRHGIDSSIYSAGKKERSGGSITMLMVTSFVRHKGVHVAVKALVNSKNRDLKLIIYGDISGNDPYVSEILEMAKNDPRIIFKGTVSQDLLGEAFKEADVFLIPVIWYENEPFVVKAAMFTGIPVIASRIGSLPEMIRHEQNGWLLPSGDVPAWTEAFDNLTGQKLAGFKVQPVGVKTMNDNFNEILDLYKNITE
jgi:glycosyltransferase involved in cell wall biosynthesis